MIRSKISKGIYVWVIWILSITLLLN